MNENKKGPSHWLLERLVLGELDADTAADVRRRLAAEGRSVEDVVAGVAASNQEIMEKHPPLATVAAIRRRAAAATAAAPKPASRRAFVWAAPFALAGAAAVLLVARPWAPRVTDGVPAEALQWDGIKGPDQLHVYRHRAAGDERLRDGARAERGDLLQLAYASRAGRHGVLLSIDGARKVTVHLPENNGGQAVRMRDGGAVRLPFAYQLDDAPGFERFFFVHAAESFDVAPILAAARALAERGATAARREPLPLPARFEQLSLAVDKTPPAKKDTR